jgi:non-ribosomal peptide synthase protein (TIGR01720 family)
VRGFRIEIGEIEAVLATHPAVAQGAVVARTDGPGEVQLVAYVVQNPVFGEAVEPEPGSGSDELRHFLRQKLPEYMVPAWFVTIDGLPKTPHGKLDRRALPAPDWSAGDHEQGFVAPRDRRENLLASIWCEVLGREQIGVHDDFFSLGGDSILSIQVVSRAARAGLRLTPGQLFQHPTIARLAAVAGAAPRPVAEQQPVVGPVPLTPIQRWFFEQENPAPGHFNQSLLLRARTARVRASAAPLLPEALCRRLLLHHDALRLRFLQQGEEWRQAIAEPREALGEGAPPSMARLDLRALPAAAQERAFDAAAAGVQASLDLMRGPLVRFIQFDLGDERRLLIVIHHLAVDGVSWRILLEDVTALLEGGETAELPAKTTSFKTWGKRLAEYGASPELAREADYWLGELPATVPPLPVDHAASDLRTADRKTFLTSLDAETTEELLHSLPAGVEETLVAVLVRALHRWTGYRRLLIELEGHGREEIFDGVDLSRTVGWFTTLYPVLFELPAAPDDAPRLLRRVKEKLRSVPQRGIGFGLLRYLGDAEMRRKLADRPQPEVRFNYLGRFDSVLPASLPLSPSPESRGPEHSPLAPLLYRLDLNAFIQDGRLQVSWAYPRTLYRPSTIEALAESFTASVRLLIEGCRSSDVSSYVASDFPEAELDQGELENILEQLGVAGGF